VKEDRCVRGDELSRRKFGAGLTAARADLAVCGSTIAQLSDHAVVAIKNANLTVEVGAHHPFALRIEVARHSQVGFIFDGSDMRTGQRENLCAAISTIGDNEHGFFAARIDP